MDVLELRISQDDELGSFDEFFKFDLSQNLGRRNQTSRERMDLLLPGERYLADRSTQGLFVFK